MAVDSGVPATSVVDALPDELWLQIIDYLEPYELATLQQVSRKIQLLCLDNDLWKRHCFDDSTWYQNLLRRRKAASNAAMLSTEDEFEPPDTSPAASAKPYISCERAQKVQDFVNWDPSYEHERVCWYDEYRQRVGPASVSWLEAPSISDRGLEAIIEARGVAMYAPYDGKQGTKFAVSPLDDGSVCIWDINGSRSRQGGIISRSKPDVLFAEGSGDERLRSQKIDSSISDRITIDNDNHRAYIAVQSHLLEVDLNRLEVISDSSFEFSISTLSAVHQDKPLVVGSSLGIHLHDFRQRARGSGIFDSDPLPPYASLSQPTPTSILYLPRPGGGLSNDICVGGRFTSILHYDLRRFPSIVKSNHSGAQITSLAALPYSFSTLDHEVRASGEPSADMVRDMKSKPGSTLIAGGGYHQKGSLELYGLDPSTDSNGSSLEPKAVARNRNQAASAPILSVVNHGTKIAFSDGSGLIKWFERDGTTECRALRIGHSEAEGRNTIFSTQRGLDDVARKIISTRTSHDESPPMTNNDNLLLWTGERLGMVSFTSSPLFHESYFIAEEAAPTAEEQAEQEYADQMRAALERHADDVKFMTGLNMGTRSAFGL